MRKTYLSREISKAMERMGEPVGDPFGGPAYGKREMPLIAVAAVYFAAAEIATVGLTLWTAVAAAGAVISAVGVVTKSEDMIKVGGIMSLAGGVGGMADKAGWFSGAAETAGDGAQITNAAAGEEAAAQSATQQALESSSPVVDAAKTSGGTEAAKGIAEAGAESVAGSSASSIPDLTPADLGTSAANNLATDANVQAGMNANGTVSHLEYAANSAAREAATGSGGFFDNFKKAGAFVEKNPMASAILAQAVGGMFDTKKAAEADQAKAIAAYYATRTNEANQQLANSSGAGVPTAARKTGPSSIFNQNSPTYNGVKPSGLAYATRG